MTTTFTRLMENNLAEVITASADYSSQQASFPFSNAINRFRSKQWKASGRFELTSTNNLIYINDGTDKTITLTTGDYTTPALMATHIQTKLNASSSNWTVSYDSSSTFKFTIAHTGSATLRLSQTTNSAWDTLGYTTTLDLVGTSFIANEQRNHTSEGVIFDLGYAGEVTFFAAIGTLDETFSISDSATIKLYANNVLDWSSPPLDVTLSRSNTGIYKFLDLTITDTNYRFWKLDIVDKFNPLGPSECVVISHVYLGDHVELSHNISKGFRKKIIDPSIKSESENGALYFDSKTKYCQFENCNFGYLDKDDITTIEEIFYRIGRSNPLYISIDPSLIISNSTEELTKYVVFDSEPSFDHVIRDLYNYNVSFRELV